MKISRIYGLKYPNPKSGESMVLWYLRKFGIQRRDPAEHIRKVTEETVDGWELRYQKGESLKEIAGDIVSPVTVWNRLRQRGVKLRDKVEAQIAAVSKYEKHPFGGKESDKAYLCGFAMGDLNIVQHGRAVRARTTTTHPAMAQLFEQLFAPHGKIHIYPRRAKWSAYEWSLEVDLDSSFMFLFGLNYEGIRRFADQRNLFLSFVAGFFDAEGSIYFHRKSKRLAPECSITNTNHKLLKLIQECLSLNGIHSKLDRRRSRGRVNEIGASVDVLDLRIWRFDDVMLFLKQLPLRHPEKNAKSKLISGIQLPLPSSMNDPIGEAWEQLLNHIRLDSDAFVDEARMAFQ